MNSILIIDDQPGMRRTLEILLRREGYQAVSVESGEGVSELLRDLQPEVVLADLKMEPLSGIDVLREAKKHSPRTAVIIMTAYGTIESAVEAMRLGAFDYITKPFKNNEIVLKVKKALEESALLSEVQRLRREVDPVFGAHPLIAESPAMKAVLEQVQKIAPTPLTVLITGETGTGKTQIAKAIHYNSTMAKGRFISVNAAAVPEPLLESELFGHEKGAFTGAIHSRKGLFEEAHRGTLFLDEIGTLSANLQSKLLGVLQDREIRRVGANRPIAVDVRIIAATNTNLEEAVARGEFRRDLFYRLNVARVHMPPLRERREDIAPLVRYFLSALSQRMGKIYEIGPEALDLLLKHDYPGNIRELQNALEWAVAVSPGPLLRPEDLPEPIRTGQPIQAVPSRTQAPRTLDEHEKQLIIDTIARCRGNLAEAAKILNIGRTTLWRKMREYGIGKKLNGRS
jgi:DNA-binding NtrC family response regulator